MLEKSLTELMNMHYGPKEAPLALISSPLRHTGAGCDRDATWVKLLCNSVAPFQQRGAVCTPRTSRTDVANSSGRMC